MIDDWWLMNDADAEVFDAADADAADEQMSWCWCWAGEQMWKCAHADAYADVNADANAFDNFARSLSTSEVVIVRRRTTA